MRNAAFTLALLAVGASATVPISASLLAGTMPVVLASGADAEAGSDPQKASGDKTDGAKTDREKAAEAKRKLDEEAKAVEEKLVKGLKAKEPAERRAAIAEASATPHPRVIGAISKALRDDEPEVVRTTLDSLGTMDHPAAKKALESFLRSKKRALRKDVNTYVSAIRAAGRHGTADSLKLLLEGAFEEEERRVLEARVFGAAKQRSREALEAMISGMRGADPRFLRTRMDAIQTSLIWITGKDLGADPSAWTDWWRKEGKTFEIPAKAPRMTEERGNRWRGFWGEEARYDRQKKRGDRG